MEKQAIMKYFTARDDLAAWFPISGAAASIMNATAKPCQELTKSGKEISQEEQGKNGYIVSRALLTGVVRFAWPRYLPIAEDGRPIIPGYISDTGLREILGDFLPRSSGDWCDCDYTTPLGEKVPEPTWPRPSITVGYGTLAGGTFFFTEPTLASDIIIVISYDKDFRAKYGHDFELWCEFVTSKIDAKIENKHSSSDYTWMTIIAPRGEWADAAVLNSQERIGQLYQASKEAKEEYESVPDFCHAWMSIVSMSFSKFYATTVQLTEGKDGDPDTVRLNAGKMSWEYVVTPERLDRLERIAQACKQVAGTNKAYENFNPEALYLALSDLGYSPLLF